MNYDHFLKELSYIDAQDQQGNVYQLRLKTKEEEEAELIA